MERLWSPWRLKYVAGASTGDIPCVFCDAPGAARHDLVVARGSLCYVILNLYPYNSGHVMVAPVRHVATLAATTRKERDELMRLTRHAEIALTEAYAPQGINIGVNLGRPAGA